MSTIDITVNSKIHDIKDIRFGVYSPEQMKKLSVCEITMNPEIPLEVPQDLAKDYGTLDDPRLGVKEPSRTIDAVYTESRCVTCGLDYNNCPGHFGYMVLQRPCFIQTYFKLVIKLLNCVCHKCGHVLLNEEQREMILKLNPKNRINVIVGSGNTSNNIRKEKIDCYYCGIRQARKYTEKRDINYVITCSYYDENFETQTKFLNAADAWDILRRVPDNECILLGMDPELCKPSSLIWSVMLIPGPQVRPAIEVRGKKNPDDLTHFLKDIIRYNTDLAEAIKSEDSVKIRSNWDYLQLAINAYIDSSNSKNNYGKKTAQPRVSIKPRLSGKSGRMRANLMGKRVNNTARSVLTCDPDIDADQLGVPKTIAMNMTFPEIVNVYNKDFLEVLCRNGPNVYPGATKITRKSDNITYMIGYNSKPLELGDIVHRHMLDNDLVMFNRQPSLHRMNIMCHRVKVLDYDTFRISANVTTPYNADFDGDEMNLINVGTYSQLAEMKYLMHVSTQLISPQFNSPIIGTVQDSTLGPYLATLERYLPPSWYQQILGTCYRNITSSFDISRDINKDKNLEHQFSTANLLSQMLPPNFDYNKKGVTIVNSIVTTSPENLVIKKDHLSNGKYNTVFQMAYNSLGPNQAIQLLNKFGRFANQYLLYNGFGLGLKDCFPVKGNNFSNFIHDFVKYFKTMQENIIMLLSDTSSKNEKTAIDKIMKGLDNVLTKLEKQYKTELNKDKFDNLKNKVKSLRNILEILIVHTPAEIKESFPSQIYDTCTDYFKEIIDSESIGQFKGKYNAMERMISGGSKGSPANMSGMIAILGRQDLEGHWIPNNLNRRSLVYFTRDDYRPNAHGYIGNSYLSGLTPTEYYFAAISGRNQQIMKSIKPAETGYTQHKIIKTIEDTHTGYDGSVRTSNNFLLETLYGDDGFNVNNLIETKIQMPIGLSVDDFIEAINNKSSFKGIGINVTGSKLTDMELETIRDYYTVVHNCANINKVMLPIDIPDKVKLKIMGFKKSSNVRSGRKKTVKEESKHMPDDIPICIRLADSIRNLFNDSNKIFKISLLILNCLVFMNTQSELIQNYSTEDINTICSEIYTTIKNAMVLPTENVGVIAGQSIGQPLTQSTLNSFHSAGAKSAVTQGAPRMKELLGNSSPSTPSMTIVLTSDFTVSDDIKSVEKAFKQKAEDIQSKLKNIKFTNMYAQYTAMYNNKGFTQDNNYLFKPDYPEEYTINITYELDKYYLAFNRISLNKLNILVNSELRRQGLKFITDYTVTKSSCNYMFWFVPTYLQNEGVNDFITRVVSIINEIQYTGIAAIVDSYIEEIKFGYARINPTIATPMLDNSDYKISSKVKDYVTINTTDYMLDTSKQMNKKWKIITVGTDLLTVLSKYQDSIDTYNTYSNDVKEVYDIFGIEAYRSALIHEIDIVMNGENGNDTIDRRHHTLLVDSMSRRGIYTNIDRHGIVKNGSEVLQRASFEQTVKEVADACTNCEIDHMNSISDNLMCGQLLKTGTNASAIRLNLGKFTEFAKLIEKPSIEATSTADTHTFGLLFKIVLNINI